MTQKQTLIALGETEDTGAGYFPPIIITIINMWRLRSPPIPKVTDAIHLLVGAVVLKQVIKLKKQL